MWDEEFHETGTVGVVHPGKGFSWAGVKGVCGQDAPLGKADIDSGRVSGALLRHLGQERGANGNYRRS